MAFKDFRAVFDVIFPATETSPGPGALVAPFLPCKVEAAVSDLFNQLEDTVEGNALNEVAWRKLVEEKCDAECDSVSSKKKVLYNAAKFRLHGVECQRGGKCLLQLGITDYRSNIGTCANISYFSQLSRARGVGDERYLANALGVECFTTTSDGKAIMFRRSNLVSEYPGYYCFPGGHPEPEDILKQLLPTQLRSTADSVAADDCSSRLRDLTVLLNGVGSEYLVRAIFDSAVMEVADELGVDRSICTNRGLLSIVKNATNRKPDAIFWVEVNETALEVQNCFDSRAGADAYESAPRSLLLVDIGDFDSGDASIESFVEERLNGKITPASLACLLHGTGCLRASRF
uniref:Nudix hydrolase domain-containing protein n=1 Tax=Trypanosoma congolense (strain IL3000) TaxID=1068625 RepID=G0UNT9_TRYCI|nr:conserved hypothetical protein [Trypanosoma congolense IL3000]